MYILIVEDDKLQFETICKSLAESRAYGKRAVKRIVTELEFRDTFEKIANDNPLFIVMDVMLKWTTKERLVLPPKEIEEKGFYRAGLRCEKMLAEDSRTKHIPIIIYSVLGQDDLKGDYEPRPQVRYVDKDFSSWEIEKAIRSIKA
jgi:CheY-like chemotaxis protein